MKKAGLAIALVLLSVLTACSTAAEIQPDPTAQPTTPPTAAPTATPTPELTPEPSPETDDSALEQKLKQQVLTYLAALGLDEDTEYMQMDWFDIKGSDEKSVLVDILSISEEAFADIEVALADGGYTQPQDATYDEKNKVRFIQYSRDDLFMEMAYFEQEQRINIHFVPKTGQ